jgi:hypothetical protein
MSLWRLPVQLATQTEHFHADRRLAFQVLTAFGKKDTPDGSSLILKDEGTRQLVEFRSE